MDIIRGYRVISDLLGNASLLQKTDDGYKIIGNYDNKEHAMDSIVDVETRKAESETRAELERFKQSERGRMFL